MSEPTPPVQPAPAPEPPAPPPVGDPPPKPPDGLPTHYWDDKTNAVRTDDVVKDFVGLHKFKSDYDARLAAVPADGAYKLELPKEFEIPAGVQIKFDEKDERVADAKALAKEIGLDQGQFSRLLTIEAKRTVAEYKKALADIEAEQAKLGEKFPEREKALTSFVASALTGNAEQKAAKHKALQQVLTNAAAFEGFEDIINRIGGTKIPGNPGQDPPAPSPQSHAERIWPNGFSSTPQQKVG